MGVTQRPALCRKISSAWEQQMTMKGLVGLVRELENCYAVRDAQQRSISAVLAMVSSSSSKFCHSRTCCMSGGITAGSSCWLIMHCLRLPADADSPAEVPEGDWYCWFCAKERKLPYQHAKTPVSNRLLAGDLLRQLMLHSMVSKG
jgi:hypothetical protein